MDAGGSPSAVDLAAGGARVNQHEMDRLAMNVLVRANRARHALEHHGMFAELLECVTWVDVFLVGFLIGVGLAATIVWLT